MTSLRLLALQSLDARIVAAQALEREADATAGLLDDLTNRERRLRYEARRLRRDVEEDQEVEQIVADADAELVPGRRGRGLR